MSLLGKGFLRRPPSYVSNASAPPVTSTACRLKSEGSSSGIFLMLDLVVPSLQIPFSCVKSIKKIFLLQLIYSVLSKSVFGSLSRIPLTRTLPILGEVQMAGVWACLPHLGSAGWRSPAAWSPGGLLGRGAESGGQMGLCFLDHLARGMAPTPEANHHHVEVGKMLKS